MTDVTVDELFTWRDGPDGTFALKAAKAFGGHHCFCSMKTFSEIKERCDVIERQTQAWMNPVVMAPLLNSVNIHVDDTVPNGIIRGRIVMPKKMHISEVGIFDPDHPDMQEEVRNVEDSLRLE